RGVDAVPVPVAGEGDVARLAVLEAEVGGAAGARVPQIPDAIAHHTHGVDAVPVPVPHHRCVPYLAVAEHDVRAAVGALQVPAAVDEDPRGDLAVALPVADHRDALGGQGPIVLEA